MQIELVEFVKPAGKSNLHGFGMRDVQHIYDLLS